MNRKEDTKNTGRNGHDKTQGETENYDAVVIKGNIPKWREESTGLKAVEKSSKMPIKPCQFIWIS